MQVSEVFVHRLKWEWREAQGDVFKNYNKENKAFNSNLSVCCTASCRDCQEQSLLSLVTHAVFRCLEIVNIIKVTNKLDVITVI